MIKKKKAFSYANSIAFAFKIFFKRISSPLLFAFPVFFYYKSTGDSCAKHSFANKIEDFKSKAFSAKHSFANKISDFKSKQNLRF